MSTNHPFDKVTEENEEPDAHERPEIGIHIDLFNDDQTKDNPKKWDIFGVKHTDKEVDKMFQEAEDLSTWSFWKI